MHYLSAKLCWFVAQRYGSDAVITPSLWGQEIIDALLFKTYPAFGETFRSTSTDGSDPISRFNDRLSTSLATAGFPNTIAVLVGGEDTARNLGEMLCQQLRDEWSEIAQNVREGIPDHPIPELRQGIRDRAIAFLEDPKNQEKIKDLLAEFAQQGGHDEQNQHDLENWKRKSCWEWRKLWDTQINSTWQPYWTAVPLGDPQTPLAITENNEYEFDEQWIQSQETVAQTRAVTPPPTKSEKIIYRTLNTGTWWGSIQARCAQAIQAIKNTRTWEIPVSPGARSTLSGQLSALHPQFRYCGKYREGYGLPLETLRLFWRLIAEVYPGLFDGSEMLNALELTKRMAWVYGGVGQSLGIEFNASGTTEIDYSQFIRFPNLSSIASARFAYQDWQQNQNQGKLHQYWKQLQTSIRNEFRTSRKQYKRFFSRTRVRPCYIPKADACINPNNQTGRYYNGVMFSSKWLADDMSLTREEIRCLRPLIETAHQATQFGEASPSDWWVIVLGDGDGMGNYVSGKKLHPYQQYLTEIEPERLIDPSRYPYLDTNQYQQRKQEFIQAFRDNSDSLLRIRKRMGPATHVGLNRALLDFSNRLVPFITEKRFCGRVVYSGGDDVMAVLPLEDLPDYLLSLRAAWCGDPDPYQPQNGDPDLMFQPQGGYWQPHSNSCDFQGLPDRALFTMGQGATMSLGIVIAHKSVPLPVALEALWEAEKDRAKKMHGTRGISAIAKEYIPPKNGLCFRVLYGSGNSLEALIKGELFADWRDWMNTQHHQTLSSLLYRLAEELPRRATLSKSDRLIAKTAQVLIARQDDSELIKPNTDRLLSWLERWEDWANLVRNRWIQNGQQDTDEEKLIGTNLNDLSNILRFSAFWLDKMQQRQQWHATNPEKP